MIDQAPQDHRACQATPDEELLRQLLDSRIPKNEREWCAASEIERLRAALKRIVEVGYCGSGVAPRIAKDALATPTVNSSKYCPDPDHCTYADCPTAFCDRDPRFKVHPDGSHTTGIVWTKDVPKPPGQDWYWWKPYPDGVEKVMEIYYTGRDGKAGWVMCHSYGEMTISIVLQRWPHSEWSSMPVERPKPAISESQNTHENHSSH